MDYRLIENNDSYLYYKITGQYSLRKGTVILDKLYNICAECNAKRLLVDIREKNGRIPETDRTYLGDYISKINFNGSIKLAVIARKEQISRLPDNAAQIRSAQMDVFTSKTDAVKWLLS
ncbi:hypothetical protein JW948_12495 [bacterium]|nr:hypothetical protein [bacterium]